MGGDAKELSYIYTRQSDQSLGRILYEESSQNKKEYTGTSHPMDKYTDLPTYPMDKKKRRQHQKGSTAERAQ